MLRLPHPKSAILFGFLLAAGGCAAGNAQGDDSPGSGGAASASGGSGNDSSGGSSAAGGSNAGGSSSGGSSSGGSSPGTGGSTTGAGGSAPGTGGAASSTGGSGGTTPAQTGGQGGGTPPNPDAGSVSDTAAGFDVAPLTECPGASIDRLQKWLGHAFLIGSGGDSSILAQESGRYVAKARFMGGGWSEIVVLLGNSADASLDLTKSSGFTIRYSATADLWIEFRGTVHLHGGDQYGVKLPATGGMPVSKFVAFVPGDWAQIPGLDPPTHGFANVLKTANMFDIVGQTANTVAFYGLRFDKYDPVCR